MYDTCQKLTIVFFLINKIIFNIFNKKKIKKKICLPTLFLDPFFYFLKNIYLKFIYFLY